MDADGSGVEDDAGRSKFKSTANNVVNVMRLDPAKNRVVLTDSAMGNSLSNHVPLQASDDGLVACEDRVGVAKVETTTVDVVMNEYPVDCFPDKWYSMCPSCMEETPVMLFWKNLRYKAYLLVENKYFETICIILILSSSMTLVSGSGKRKAPTTD